MSTLISHYIIYQTMKRSIYSLTLLLYTFNTILYDTVAFNTVYSVKNLNNVLNNGSDYDVPCYVPCFPNLYNQYKRISNDRNDKSSISRLYHSKRSNCGTKTRIETTKTTNKRTTSLTTSLTTSTINNYNIIYPPTLPTHIQTGEDFDNNNDIDMSRHQ